MENRIVHILTIGVLVMLALSATTQAATHWYSGHHYIQEGDSYGDVYVWNNATVDMTGGAVTGWFISYDQSTINMSGGDVSFLRSRNSSTINLSGGKVSNKISSRDNSTINFSGGKIGGGQTSRNILSTQEQGRINFSDGSVGTLAAYGGTINFHGGQTRTLLAFYSDSTIHISGGRIIAQLMADGGSVVNIYGHYFDYNANGGRWNDGELTGFWEDETPFKIELHDNFVYNPQTTYEHIVLHDWGEPPRRLIGLEIVGPTEVAEVFSVGYKAIARYDDNSTKDVTGLASWSIEPDTYASIDNYGVLATKDIAEGQLATIRAGYTEGSITVEGQKAIYIFALVGIEITGPQEVPENSISTYKAIAYYDNNSTKDVTDLAMWSVEPNMIASIEAGVLTTKDIAEGQSATIQASYDQVDGTIESQKVIHIFALVGIEISGPDEVTENFSAGYQAIAYYDNNSTKDVTDSAFWEVEPNNIASIEAGMLTTKDIVKDQPATIWASYIESETTLDAEKIVDILAICITGTALQFDGVDDYVRTVNDIFSNAQLASGATLSAWFNTDSTAYGYIADNEGYLTLGVNHIYAANPNKLCGIVDGGYNRFFSSSDVTDNLWHHAAIVWDGIDTAILYLDGINVSSGHSGPPTPDRKTRPFTIGAHSTLAAYFKGKIDDVRVYNRALSGEEIWASMHSRLAGDEPGLIAYWNFDEGVGQVIYDLSNNDNNGYMGSDPNEFDVSDPMWIRSDAPIGRCTPYLIAVDALKDALEYQDASLKKVWKALDKEWSARELFEQWLETGLYGDFKKENIIIAKQKVHSASEHEEQAVNTLEKSVERLEDALSKMGYVFEPPNIIIIEPLEGSELGYFMPIGIKAYAWDVDGTVVKVEFFADGDKVGEDSSGIDYWTTTWYNHPLGTYDLTAQAIDDKGKVATSPIVTIVLVETPPPGRAVKPNPRDGATNVSVNTDLSWTAGIDTVSHDVYFGTTTPPDFRGNTTEVTFDPGKMDYETTYYWRIDEINPYGTTTGTVWIFRTGIGPPPPPPPPPT